MRLEKWRSSTSPRMLRVGSSNIQENQLMALRLFSEHKDALSERLRRKRFVTRSKPLANTKNF